MTDFQKKTLNNVNTLGERLRAVREDSGHTISEAETQTGIQEKYLIAIENSDYGQLPSEVYTRSFLKKYASWLELNPDSVIRSFEKEKTLLENTKRPTGQLKRAKLGLPGHLFFITPKVFKRSLVALIIIICFSYLGYEMYDSVSAPDLSITEPIDNAITSDYSINVVGQVDKESKLKINGQEIFHDLDGNFKESITLQTGINIIEIEAFKKRGRSTTIYRKVLVNNS